MEKQLSDAQSELTNALDEIRKKFLERVQAEIVKITTADVAEALTKKILATLHATQAELRQSPSGQQRPADLLFA